MGNVLNIVGKISGKISKTLNLQAGANIVQSSGLIVHIQKRHPSCVKYIKDIPSIISSPDYIGINPNEVGTSFELVKIYADNVQIGIKLDSKNNYFYVATLYTITNGKLQKKISSGRIGSM